MSASRKFRTTRGWGKRCGSLSREARKRFLSRSKTFQRRPRPTTNVASISACLPQRKASRFQPEAPSITMITTTKNLWGLLVFAALLAGTPQLAFACGCVDVDVIQGPYSCYNAATHCAKDYTWNGCNCSAISDWHCVNIRDVLLWIVHLP